MKIVMWTDSLGRKHRSVLQEHMPATRPKEGYLSDPPDIRELNWDELVIELHNELVNRGLFTYEDIVHSQNGLTAAILRVFRKKVKDLYRRENVRSI
jgi:hypothetical protein